MSLPLGTSQNFMVWSRLPLTRTLPSGEKAKPPIQFSKAVSHPSCDSTQTPRRSIVPSKGSDLWPSTAQRSEEHTCELQSPCNLVCRLLLEKKKKPTSSTS